MIVIVLTLGLLSKFLLCNNKYRNIFVCSFVSVRSFVQVCLVFENVVTRLFSFHTQ